MRPRTIFFLASLLLFLIALIFAISEAQRAAFQFFWLAYQLKYIVFLGIGLTIGGIIGFYIGLRYARPRIEKH